MDFDPCPQKITNLVLKAGAIIRQLKGLPEEKNITLLYDETAPLLGLPPTRMNSQMASKLPAPHETTKGGEFIIPRKDCPVCGSKESVILVSLCPSCEDSEGGKYHSAWRCSNENCSYLDKSKKFLIQVLDEIGIEVPTGMKAKMGIKTLTDEGLK